MVETIWLWGLRCFILLVPIAWWPNVEQVTVQRIIWQLGIIFLVSVGFLCERKRKPTNIWVALIVIGVVVSFLSHKLDIQAASRVTSCFLGGFLYYTVASNLESFSKIKNWLIGVGLANSALVVSQFLGYDPLFNSIVNPCGFIGMSNFCGVFLAMTAFLTNNLILFSILSIATVLTKSYIAIFAILFLIPFYVWRFRKAKFFPLFFIIPVFVILPLALISFFIYSNWEMICTTKIYWRLYFWKPALEKALNRWPDGWGLGSAAQFVYHLTPKHFIAKTMWQDLHSIPMDILFELGLLGILPVMGLLNWVRKRQLLLTLVVFVICSLVHSLQGIPPIILVGILTLASLERRNCYGDSICGVEAIS